MTRRLMCATAAVLGACAQFEDPSTVKDLRLLAAQVDPPEVLLDDASVQAPPAIRIAPLIADPTGAGRTVTWSVLACPNDPLAGAVAPGGDYTGGYPAGGARNTVASRRCPDGAPDTWTLAEGVTEPYAELRLSAAQLRRAFEVDAWIDPVTRAPRGGFELGMPLALEIRATAGEQRAFGLKRAVFWLRKVRPDQQPNRNPFIASVRIFADRHPTTLDPGPGETLPADGAVTVNGPVWVQPAAADAEAYVTAGVDRKTGELIAAEARERLTYNFFATAGSFDPGATSSELPAGFEGTSARIPLEARYRPPAGPAEVTIWIVVRDDRGGQSWVQGRLNLM